MRRPLEAHLCDAILSTVEDPSPQVREVSLCGHCVKHCPLAGALATARTQRSLDIVPDIKTLLPARIRKLHKLAALPTAAGCV